MPLDKELDFKFKTRVILWKIEETEDELLKSLTLPLIEKEKLKKLLTKDIFKSFEQVIDHRNKEKIKSELTFIGVKESDIEKFEKINNSLVATVKIICEIISVKKDKTGNTIEGNPDKIKIVTDHWKFTKDASSNDPNWFLAEIISP